MATFIPPREMIFALSGVVYSKAESHLIDAFELPLVLRSLQDYNFIVPKMRVLLEANEG